MSLAGHWRVRLVSAWDSGLFLPLEGVRGFAVPRGDTPRRHQTPTDPPRS